MEVVLSGYIANGFGTRDRHLAAALTYTNGALLAADHAARASRGFAVAPCSGFHHPDHDFGGAFCIFNGLTRAAQWL